MTFLVLITGAFFLAMTVAVFFLAVRIVTFFVLGCADLGFTVFFGVGFLVVVVFGVDFFGVDFVIPQKAFFKMQ